MIFLSAAQCRAARGLLKWSQPDLSRHCDINVQTICAFENEVGTPTKRTLRKIVIALEKEGLEFLPGDGVRKQDASVNILHGEDGIIALFDDIYETMLVYPHEVKQVLVANTTEPVNFSERVLSYLLFHLKRLEKVDIKEKILCCEGDKNFLGPKESYRWIPEEYFCENPTIIYGNKVALLAWASAKVTIIHDANYAESVRNLFHFVWHRAKIPE